MKQHKHRERIYNKKGIGILFGLFCFFSMAGCSDMIEIQDRDFVMALGASYQREEYRLTYAIPDLSTITGESVEEGSRYIRSYQAANIPLIEEQYNQNGEKRLDYRHLQVLILDESICEDKDKFQALLKYLDDNNEISRSVLVYFYLGDAEELLNAEGKINGSLGDYLKKMDNNNSNKRGSYPVTIGNLIDCFKEQRTVVIPVLRMKEAAVSLSGSIILDQQLKIKLIDEEQRALYHITQGEGSGYILAISDEDVFKVKEINSKMEYRYVNGVPKVEIRLTGSTEILSDIPSNISEHKMKNKFDRWLKKQIETEIEDHLKNDSLDYLNFYDKSSYKKRKVWIDYQDKQDKFTEDIQIELSVDMSVI